MGKRDRAIVTGFKELLFRRPTVEKAAGLLCYDFSFSALYLRN
jgi:hypothetical protein